MRISDWSSDVCSSDLCRSLEGRMPAREGAKIFHDGEEVGTVTSGGFGPSLSAPIAMAYVHAALAEPGTKVEIEVRGKRLAATVTPMPFVPHRYHRQDRKSTRLNSSH